MNESLSVGIVTYNHGRILDATLRTALAHLPAAMPSHIWVLDNHSSDGSAVVARAVAAADPRVTVIENDRNIGFGSGNNRILQQVDSTYHVLLNPDVTLTSGALDTLVAYLRTAPDVALVCPRVHFEDGRLQSLNRRHPTLVDLFVSRFMPTWPQPWVVRRIQRYRMEDIGYEHTYDVPFVSGAFMCCRTAVLRKIGGFDPRYFLYFEDVDLSRKLQRAGWRTTYCPEAVVTHGWQRASHSSHRHMLHFCLSAMKYFNKWGWQAW
jgi:GT2 family glycosyltransferase